ncbi:MAG: DMT family transporter, partial [Lachnospirales bacterium]
SAFCFALMNCFVRLAGDLPTIQKSFFRNFIAVMAAAFIIIKDGFKNNSSIKEQFHYNKEDLPLLIIRSACGTLGILGNFYAVSRLNISDASMLNKLSPFFAVIFSYLFLKEKPKAIQAIGVVIAFIGSIFIIKPSMDFSHTIPALVGFCGGIGAGAAYTAVRGLGMRGVKGPKIVFFFSAFSCIVTLPYILFSYAPMSLYQLIILLCAGLAASGGQFAITAAYTNAPAKEVSVFDYSQIVFAAALGFILFDQIPDIYSIIGYVIIFSVSIVLFIYNNKK